MRKYLNEAMVVIDNFPQSVGKYREDHAIVCVDVIRSTTTAITAVATGRRCFPASSLDRALALSNTLSSDRPLLAGETSEDKHAGFGISNSPSVIASRDDIERPLILLSSSGTELLHEASRGLVTFLACLRNYVAAAEILAGRYRKVAVIGAGSHNEFREEDQMCCAWIAEILAAKGFKPATRKTRDLISRWQGAPVESFLESKSAAFLRKTGQEEDLEFILSHVGDLDASFIMAESEVLMIPRVFSLSEESVSPVMG